MVQHLIDFIKGTTASEIQLLLQTLGEEHIAALSRQVQEFITNNEDVDNSMTRCRAKSMDAFMKFEWAPADLKASARLPESTSTFGTPWVMHNSAASCRYGPEEWPAIGCGGFLYCLEGKAFLLLWPMEFPAEVNVTYDQAWSFLGSMHPQQFNQFLNGQVYHCLLDPTEVAWIPYGWAAAAIALADEPYTALYLPYASTRMLSEVQVHVLDHMAEGTAVCINDDGLRQTQLGQIAPAYHSWVTAAASAKQEEDEMQVGSEEETAVGAAAGGSGNKRGHTEASSPASMHGKRQRGVAQDSADGAAAAVAAEDGTAPVPLQADPGSVEGEDGDLN